MFSCGTMTTCGSFQPSFCPLAYASTTGAKSVPPFANRYSMPREASSPSQASAAVSGLKAPGSVFGAAGASHRSIRGSVLRPIFGAAGCGFSVDAGCDFGCGASALGGVSASGRIGMVGSSMRPNVTPDRGFEAGIVKLSLTALDYSMNCAERLVEMFGSQADVARAFQLDRAVVHNWVKTGYVPARWAGEVERVTQGRISALDVIHEASAKNPVRVKSRPEHASFGLYESEPMSQYAPAKRIQSFHPPQRTLMGPGPTEIHPRVLTTMSQPAIGYLDPIFVEMMEELKSLLRYVYQTKNALTFPLSGPGSVGMEFCFVNMVAPGDKVVVCQNGVFGGRMLENVIRCGGTPVLVEDNWGDPVDPQKLEDALKNNRDARLVAFVHGETSTGVQSDAKALVEIAHKYDALAIVDAVTTLGGTPVKVDEWEIDAIYSASQKCLSCTPGLSPVSFNERVVEHVKKRKDKIHS